MSAAPLPAAEILGLVEAEGGEGTEATQGATLVLAQVVGELLGGLGSLVGGLGDREP
jgi:hypothetical protein